MTKLSELDKAKQKALGSKPKPDNYDSKKAEMLRETVPTAVVIAPSCPCPEFTALLAKGCGMLQQLAEQACKCEHAPEPEQEELPEQDDDTEADEADDTDGPPEKTYR